MAAGEAILSEAATEIHTQDEAVEELVRQHSRMVYRIAYAALRSHHDAEDATQETYLRVLRHGRLASVSDPKSWLARIAWRVAVERSRRRGRSVETPLDDSAEAAEKLSTTDASAEQSVQGSQVGILLEQLIAALPQKLRAPLILSAVEELSPCEIAVALGINEASVRSRVFRARHALRERLTKRIATRRGSKT